MFHVKHDKRRSLPEPVNVVYRRGLRSG